MTRGFLPARQQGILQTLFSFPVSSSLQERDGKFCDCRQQIPCTLDPLHPQRIKSKNNCSAPVFFNYSNPINNRPYELLAATISSELGKLLPSIEAGESMVPVVEGGEIELEHKAKINLFTFCYDV